MLQAVGLAWLALELTSTVSYSNVWLPFVVSGVGMALFFVPLASVVLSSVRPEQEGVASGANSCVPRGRRGVLGIAVLGAVFSARGGYTSGAAYVAGLRPAVWVGPSCGGGGWVPSWPWRFPAVAAGRAGPQADTVASDRRGPVRDTRRTPSHRWARTDRHPGSGGSPGLQPVEDRRVPSASGV